MTNTVPMHETMGKLIKIPAEEFGFHCYHELPPEIKKNNPRYIFKLDCLEDIKDEITWGWGDGNYLNMFEIIKEGIDSVEKEAKTGRFTSSIKIYCDKDGSDYPNIDLDFMCFEVPDNSHYNFVYVCYYVSELEEDDDYDEE